MSLETSEASGKAGPGIHCSGYLIHTPIPAILQLHGDFVRIADVEIPRIISEHWLREEDLAAIGCVVAAEAKYGICASLVQESSP